MFVHLVVFSALIYFSSQQSPDQAKDFNPENSVSRFAIVLPRHRYRHTLQRNGIPLPRMGVGRTSVNSGTKAISLTQLENHNLKNVLDNK